MTDVVEHNRHSWNRQAVSGDSPWCEPVDAAVIAAARRGEWAVILTPNIPVPRHWLGDLDGQRVLCLASGGGQQAPVLAAVGARVTSFDNADEQLAIDAAVAARIEAGDALEFSHSLNAQIGGQIEAGFVIAGFYEDHWNARATPLDDYMPTSMATRAIKLDL